MFGWLKRRSILMDMGFVFCTIIVMGIVAGVIVARTNDQLVSDARDAVWEASVPPAQVFSMINAQWLIHEQLGSALASGQGQAKAIAAARELDARGKAVWKELFDLSPYFPSDVKAEVDKTNHLLEVFGAATAKTIAGLQAANPGSDRATLAEQQSAAILSLATQVAHMLDVMRSRIEHVNQRMEATSADGLMRLMWIAVVLAGLIIACGAVVLLRMIRPIGALTRTMAALAASDLSVEIPSSDRSDEIGRMAQTVRVFKMNAIETISLRDAQEQQRQRAATERSATMADLARRFEASVGAIVQAVSRSANDLERSAEAMSSSTDRAASRSTAVAADSQEATENVRAAASLTEQLSRMMSDVGSQTAAAEARIQTAVVQARDTDEEVRLLGQSANSIGSVVGVIAEIANQTNLLALNATIEAARAGDYGRGFAVVASEVKQLATETAKATTDITAQIEAMQSATATTIQSIRRICEIISDVADITRQIGNEIDGQVTATQEIASSVGKAAMRTVTVTQNIGEVNQAVQGSERIATDVLGAARDLSRNGSTLKAEVDQFLTSVRSA